MDFGWFTVSVVSIEFVSFGLGLWALKRWVDRRYNALHKENEALQEEFKRFQRQDDTRYNALQGEFTAAQTEADSRINTLLKRNAALREETDKHIAEFKAFQSQVDRRYNALAKENESIRKAIDGYIEENAALQKAIEKHTAEIEELRQQNQELQTGFDIMSGRYAELKEQLFPMLEKIMDRLAQR